MKIVTDSTPVEKPKDPLVDNVFTLYALLATPGLTGITDRAAAYRQHVLDSLAAAAVVGGSEGPVIETGRRLGAWRWLGARGFGPKLDPTWTQVDDVMPVTYWWMVGAVGLEPTTSTV